MTSQMPAPTKRAAQVSAQVIAPTLVMVGVIHQPIIQGAVGTAVIAVSRPVTTTPTSVVPGPVTIARIPMHVKIPVVVTVLEILPTLVMAGVIHQQTIQDAVGMAEIAVSLHVLMGPTRVVL